MWIYGGVFLHINWGVLSAVILRKKKTATCKSNGKENAQN